jgi:Mrp family chromosome partitioning ATPase
VVPVPVELAQNVSLGHYLPLIQRLVEMRGERGTGIVAAFTALSRGEGVTFVVESLAWELARQTGEQVLLTTPSGLSNAELALLLFSDKPPSPVTRLTASVDNSRLATEMRPRELDALRDRFGFVLVDCPSMRESAAALSLSPLSDGIVLVTAAGQVRRGEIEYMRGVLHATAANIIGLVLNKRVDPIPAFLSRLL